VPKKMQAFGEAFYGRAAAYDMAMTDGAEALARAISRNVLDAEGIENARRLATYVQGAMTSLASESDVNRLGTSWMFPLPLAEGA